MAIVSAILLGTMIGLGADYAKKHFNEDGTPGDIVSRLDGLTNDLSDTISVHTGKTTEAIGDALDTANKDWFNF